MSSGSERIAWAVVAFALLTSAQQEFGSVGLLSPGDLGRTPEATQLVADLGRTPNATSYVTFNRTDDNMLETWGWRINITDIPVPNDPHRFGEASADSSQGLHVTNMQWQLHWPGDDSGTFQSYLAERNATLYSWDLRLTLPSNITSRINNQTNGNCSAILGDECVMSSGSERIAWAVVAFALLTSAQQEFGSVGLLSPGDLGRTPEATQLVADLGRTPNATSYVTFNRTDDNMLETWGWRINITDIPVPNDPHRFGEASADSSQGLHVTNMQWQLHWPGDDSGTFQSYLAERNATLYSWDLRLTLPSNITSRINNQTNGNCSAILGDECATSLAQAASEGKNAFFNNLDGCAGTFDVGYHGGWGFGLDSNVTNTSALLYPNGTFTYYTSPPYPGGNDTIFNEAKTAMQFLTLNFESDALFRGGSGSGASVVCQVVDTSAAAGGWLKPTAVMWTLAALSTLVVMWQ
nr:hypothetical protein CFP56_21608 [Quercus suber]